MDLAITAYVLTFCAAIVFRVGKKFGTRHPVIGQFLFAGGIVVATWLAWNSAGSLRWAHFFPFSHVLFLANASVILVVGSAGLLVGTHCLSRWKQQFAVTALCATAACFIGSAVVRPLWQPVQLSTGTTWRDGVCLQSHEATCAPAASATLLAFHGISQSESAMAVASLTSERGTLSLGTFRGLCVELSDARIAPRALICNPRTIAESEISRKLPLLAHVDFQKSTLKPRRLGGWRTNDGHAVVVLKRLGDGNWLIADPAVGKIRWSDDYFREKWIGEGIYLVAK